MDGFNGGQDWRPESSWVVLEEQTLNCGGLQLSTKARQRFSSCPGDSGDRHEPSGDHPDNVWLEDAHSCDSRDADSDFDEETLRITPAVGMSYGDSMVQAERSLGLAVSLDGMDQDFLKKTSETIAHQALIRENQQSPVSRSSISSDDYNARESEFVMERNDASKDPQYQRPPSDEATAQLEASKSNFSKPSLKYGGRAPPVLGALAPPVVQYHSKMIQNMGVIPIDRIDHAEKVENSPQFHIEGIQYSTVDTEYISAKKRDRENSKRDKSVYKTEKRKLRRDQRTRKGEKLKKKEQEMLASGFFWSYSFGSINLRTVVPFVVSHMVTLLIGIYIGRQYRNNTPTNKVGPANTIGNTGPPVITIVSDSL